MRINCDSCGKEFTLPEEKLPDAARFRVKCPSCGHRIAVERPARESGRSGEAGKETDRGSATGDPEDLGGVEHLGLSPEKEKNALLLVADHDLLEAVRAPLELQGFHWVAPSSSKEAIRIFHSNPLVLLVVEDREESEPLLRELHSQPGYIRREINCVLVGDRAKSFEQQQAFLLGVNTYLARSEMDRFSELLPRAVGKHWQFMHPWLLARGEV